MVSLKHFLWTVPFLCFSISYIVFYYVFASTSLVTPELIGKQLQDALQVLSDHNLNARILSQKEDEDCIPGTILSQMPAPQRIIRPHQSVFLVLSKKPVTQKAPTLLQKNKQEIEKIAAHQGLSLKEYYFTSNYPENVCIGQLPSGEQPLNERRLTVYLSNGSSKKPVLLPSFKKRPLSEVTSFLTEHGIKFHTIHAKPVEPNHVCTNCIILDQKPLAGSLVDLCKPLTIQLYVQ